MRPRSWLAVSVGTLTGSALAMTGSPHNTARPRPTAAHLRAAPFRLKIGAKWLLNRQGVHMIHYVQTPNNGTITTGLPDTYSGIDKSGPCPSSRGLRAV